MIDAIGVELPTVVGPLISFDLHKRLNINFRLVNRLEEVAGVDSSSAQRKAWIVQVVLAFVLGVIVFDFFHLG